MTPLVINAPRVDTQTQAHVVLSINVLMKRLKEIQHTCAQV